MTPAAPTYTGAELYQILLPGHEAADVIFANHIRQWHPGCRINIKQ